MGNEILMNDIQNTNQACEILLNRPQGYFESKRSRFLALAVPVYSEAEALAVLEARRKEYYDARHHCYAYTIGSKGELFRAADDGEPAGTGGKPIGEALIASGLSHTLVVVTRYFGGTLLGAGPLARAYFAAAQDCLKQAETARLYFGNRWQIVFPYTDLARVERLVEQQAIPRGEAEYGADVTWQLFLTAEQEEAFLAGLSEASLGRALGERGEALSFLVQKGRAIPFDGSPEKQM